MQGAEAGTCHMMAAQIHCNYLEHAFRQRCTTSPPLSLTPLFIPPGHMSVTKFCGQLKMAVVVWVCVTVCVCVPGQVYAFCHLIICIFSPALSSPAMLYLFSVLLSTGCRRRSRGN